MAKTRMLINYIPGDECRIAVLEDEKLEELHAERMSAVSRVGNIYVGKVANVESAIQAAFIDFGIEHHGFLHVTDLHPRYFPGAERDETESVGKKTPRRERPPIQECLKRGQEVMVQVLKEGVGTKGPTLTSYLSIPGRFLVMMPQMDRVGVSRKVEDDEQRREMRKILDQLDLPEGFGFILRTAGMDRTKAELKRDLAYVQRLWRDMEVRRRKGKAPRLLYSESDLLLRILRDVLSSEIKEVIIDNELALDRASRFLKIVAPRTQTRLLHYNEATPMFHAFGVEEQIQRIHAREVPLPSGGRLVIDETEALVAIDVNSGKSRSARDAETNAYKTNLEATDEICRQLRLRDLGGLVILDLIDMRDSKHRRAVEGRFRERLKRDRARSTILPISGFGILEMTRQRMRGSHESQHFVECPTCRGRGLVQKPDSVAADAIRTVGAAVAHQRVARVELVVSPRVAGELLSGRRRWLSRLERRSGKQVDVRVSETLPIDRITLYAYDESGSDIDLEKLPKSAEPKSLPVWADDGQVDNWAMDPADEASLAAEAAEDVDEEEPHPHEMQEIGSESDDDEDEPTPGKKKRRRRRRRRKDRDGESGESVEGASGQSASAGAGGKLVQTRKPDEAPHEDVHEESAEEGGKKKRRRRRSRSKKKAGTVPEASTPEVTATSDQSPQPEDEHVGDEEPAQPEGGEDKPKKKRRRRGGRRKKSEGAETTASTAGAAPPPPTPPDNAKPGAAGPAPALQNGTPPVPVVTQRRSLYGASRRKLSPGERATAPRED